MNLPATASILKTYQAELREVFSRSIDLGAGDVLVKEGALATECHLVLDGFMIRHKDLSGERRQITSFQLPGDICDLHGLFFPRLNFSVTALTACSLAYAAVEGLSELIYSRPAISKMLWQMTLRDAAVEREWILNVGLRSQIEQVCHLLSEVATRLDFVTARQEGQPILLPISVKDLADSVARSVSDVEHTIETLVRDGLILRQATGLLILDFERLKLAGGFNPDYMEPRTKADDTPGGPRS